MRTAHDDAKVHDTAGDVSGRAQRRAAVSMFATDVYHSILSHLGLMVSVPHVAVKSIKLDLFSRVHDARALGEQAKARCY